MRLIRIHDEGEHTQVATDAWRLRLARETLAFDVWAPRSGLRIAGLRPRALTEHGEHRPSGLRSAQVEPVPGGRKRLRFACGSDAGLEFELCLELDPSRSGVGIEVALHNVGTRPVRVAELDAVVWEGGNEDLELPGPPAELSWFALGWRGDDPAGWRGLRDPDRVGRGPFTPPGTRDRSSADLVARLGVPGRAALTLGFTSTWRWLPYVVLDHAAGRPRRLRACCPTEDRPLDPGERLAAEPLWLGLDPRGRDGLATWAERAAPRRAARRPAPPATVLGPIEAADDAAIEALRTWRAQLPLAPALLLDGPSGPLALDEIRPGAGEWGAVRRSAAQIRSQGATPALRLAALALAEPAPWERERPDALLRDGLGRTLRSRLGSTRGARLDPSHPEVRDRLQRAGRALAETGFGHLELVGLDEAIDAEAFFDPHPSRAEVLRGALAALRAGLGPAVTLTAADAPWPLCIGTVDAVRVAAGTGTRWRTRGRTPGLRAWLERVLARAPLHGRLFAHDAGRVRLDGDWSEAERDALCVALALGCASLSLPPLPPLATPQLRGLRGSLPGSTRPLDSDAFVGGVPRELRASDATDPVILARFQLDDAATEARTLPASRSGPAPRLWDALALQEAEVPDSGLIEVPAHGCRLLTWTEPEGSLWATTLHRAGGVIRRPTEPTPDGVASAELALPGEREGSVLWKPQRAEGPALRVRVEFADRLVLRVAADRVEPADASAGSR